MPKPLPAIAMKLYAIELLKKNGKPYNPQRWHSHTMNPSATPFCKFEHKISESLRACGCNCRVVTFEEVTNESNP